MQTPGIGHNSKMIGAGWRRFAWKKARKDLVGTRLPLEIVRIRVRRAQALGLSYPQYASVLLGSGRDIVGFLFTVDGLQLRLRRTLETPAHVAEKLKVAPSATRMVLAPVEEDAGVFCEELKATLGARIDDAGSAPAHPKAWREARAAVHKVLHRNKLPADAVVMVGGSEVEAGWADAAFLAKFIHTKDYFDVDKA